MTKSQKRGVPWRNKPICIAGGSGWDDSLSDRAESKSTLPDVLSALAGILSGSVQTRGNWQSKYIRYECPAVNQVEEAV